MLGVSLSSRFFSFSFKNDAFINNDMFYALTLDALVTSHPILLPVNHPDEINEIFDSITYNKVC